MKALAIVFVCMFFVSLTGFAVSMAASDIRIEDVFRGNYTIGWSGDWDAYNVSREFKDSFSDIEIGILSARTTIRVSQDGVARVDYNGNRNFRNVEFIAEVRGNTLIIKERGTIRWSGNWSWGWNTGRTTLDIELPEDVYSKIIIDITSGSISGDLPDTHDLDINVTSGNVTLRFDEDREQRGNLKSRTTSGTVNVHGFNPDTYEVHSTSGTQNIHNLSGSGTLRLTSGRVNLNFDEWDGGLRVNVTSGSASIALPEGGGAELTFSRTSGSLSYSFGNDSGRLNSSGSRNIGGDNRQRVDVNITSGSVRIYGN